MQDEARHVAFGRLALRDYYAQLTTAERADREEFVVEGYSDEELRLLLEFQRKLEDIVRGQLARLRDDLDRHAPSRG